MISVLLLSLLSPCFQPNLSDDDSFRPIDHLRDFLELSQSAPPKFADDLARFTSEKGKKLDAKALGKIRKDWEALARRIEKALNQMAEDPIERSIVSWEKKVQRHRAMRPWQPFQVSAYPAPFVIFAHMSGGLTGHDIERLEQSIAEMCDVLSERFENLITLPVALEDRSEEIVYPLWLTLDRQLYRRTLPLVGVHDHRVHWTWFSAADKALFGLLDANRDLNREARESLSVSVVTAMLDATARAGQASFRTYWIVEGIARYLTGFEDDGSLGDYRRGQLELFVNGREEWGCPGATLFAPDGVPHPLGAATMIDLPDASILEWRVAAAHAVVLFLFEGNQEKHRMTVLEHLAGEARNEATSAASLGFDKEGLLDASWTYARGVLEGRPPKTLAIEVNLESGGDSVSPSVLDPRIEFLARASQMQFAQAASIAASHGLAAEAEWAETFASLVGDVGANLRQTPVKRTIQRNGRKVRVDLVDANNEGANDEGFVIKDPRGNEERLPLREFGLVKFAAVARKAGCDQPIHRASLAVLAGIAGGAKLAKRERKASKEHAKRVDAALKSWESYLDEVRAFVAIDNFLAEAPTFPVPKSVLDKVRSTDTLRARHPALQAHLAQALEAQIPAGEDYLSARFQAGSRDAQGLTSFQFRFNDPSELDSFIQEPYPFLDNLHAVKGTPPGKFEPFVVKNGTLQTSGRSLLRFKLPLAPPIRFSLDREAEVLSDTDVFPDFVAALLDDRRGNFFAADCTFALYRIVRGKEDRWQMAGKDHQDLWGNGTLTQTIVMDPPVFSVAIGDDPHLQLEIKEKIKPGEVFFFVDGERPVTVDNLIIEGVVDESAIESARRAEIERTVRTSLMELLN